MDFLADVVAFFGDRANWRGGNGLTQLVVEHLAVSAAAMVIAMTLALPLGLVLGHTGRGGLVAVNVSNIGRALPSFAVLVIALQLSSIGVTPTLVALVLLAVPPMVTNSFVGVRGVDPDMVEAARAMGMTGRQVFTGVELPSALPLVMAGTEELYLGKRMASQILPVTSVRALAGLPPGADLPTPGSRKELDLARTMTNALAAMLRPVVEALQPGTLDPVAQPRRLRHRLTWLLLRPGRLGRRA